MQLHYSFEIMKLLPYFLQLSTGEYKVRSYHFMKVN